LCGAPRLSLCLGLTAHLATAPEDSARLVGSACPLGPQLFSLALHGSFFLHPLTQNTCLGLSSSVSLSMSPLWKAFSHPPFGGLQAGCSSTMAFSPPLTFFRPQCSFTGQRRSKVVRTNCFHFHLNPVPLAIFPPGSFFRELLPPVRFFFSLDLRYEPREVLSRPPLFWCFIVVSLR